MLEERIMLTYFISLPYNNRIKKN